MKTIKRLDKIKYIVITLALLFVLAAALVIPAATKDKPVKAAGGLTFTMNSSTTQIKTNAANKDFIVYGVVSNNTVDGGLYGAEFTINIDTNVFEFKSYMTPKQISDELKNSSLSNAFNATEDIPRQNYAGGSVVCTIDNFFQPITASSFVIGGYKIGVKSGADLSKTASVTATNISIPNHKFGSEEQYTPVGTDMSISFVPPSSACEITNLTSSQTGVTVTKDGSSFKAEVPYSVSSLDTSKLKATVSDGATVSYSPSGSVALAEEQTTTVNITVTAEDGTTQSTSKIEVTRKVGETANTLSALTVKNGNTDLISKSGDELASGATFDISDEIANADKDNISVVLTKNGTQSKIEVKLDGVAKTVGANNTVTLSGMSDGKHTLVITVTPEKGNKTEYTVTFSVAAASSTPVNPPDKPSKPVEGAPDENGFIFKPVFNENNPPVFINGTISVKDFLLGFNSDYMELSGDTEGMRAGKYTVTVTLKNSEHKWKENESAAALAEDVSFDIEWEISPFVISADGWTKPKAGEVPVLKDLPAGISDCIEIKYSTKDGEAVDPKQLNDGVEYVVTATVKDGYQSDVVFSDSSSALTQNFKYSAGFFMKELFGLKVWIWLIIAAAVILLIIVLIVIIVVHKKKAKAAKLAEERRANAEKAKAEKLEAEERRYEREERMMTRSQTPQIIPQYMPQSPTTIHVPSNDTNNAGMAAIIAEMSALKAEQRSAQEIAALRAEQGYTNEIAALRAEISALKAEHASAKEANAIMAEQRAQQKVVELKAEIEALKAERDLSKETTNAIAEQSSQEKVMRLRAEVEALKERASSYGVSRVAAEQDSQKKIDALKAEISSLKAKLEAQEVASIYSEITQNKRVNDNAAVTGISAKELSEMIAAEVKNAMANANPAPAQRPAPAARPAPAQNPAPAAKPEVKRIVTQRPVNTDNMVFDEGGFYDSVNERGNVVRRRPEDGSNGNKLPPKNNK